MGRRYIRDSLGRFASTGGGGRRAGKLSKSTGRGRSARAAYHDAKSNLRFEKRIKSEFGGKAKTGSNVTKAKRKLTTLSNRMTGKGKAAGSGIKKGLRSQTASRRKQAFRSKATKGRAARAEYKRASSADRKAWTDTGRKKVIKKQTGKPAYRDNTGFYSPQRTKAPRPGSKTKAQKIRAKIDRKKSYNKMERGSEFKGKKKGTAKQVAAGKKRSAAVKAKKATARKADFKGKATQGRAAKAKYKKAAGKAREWKEMATNPDFSSPSSRKTYASAKGQLTRVTNKMTAKGAAKAKNRKTMGKKLTKNQLREKAYWRKEQLKQKPKGRAKGKAAPRKGETASQYRTRLKRGAGTGQTMRILSGMYGSRGEAYTVPGTRVGGKKTRKSQNRAMTRETWGDGTGGNKRSRAITKSKERHAKKTTKRELASKKKAINKKIEAAKKIEAGYRKSDRKKKGSRR